MRELARLFRVQISVSIFCATNTWKPRANSLAEQNLLIFGGTKTVLEEDATLAHLRWVKPERLPREEKRADQGEQGQNSRNILARQTTVRRLNLNNNQ